MAGKVTGTVVAFHTYPVSVTTTISGVFSVNNYGHHVINMTGGGVRSSQDTFFTESMNLITGDNPDVSPSAAIEAELAVERAARIAADDAESAARIAADGTLQGNISANTTAINTKLSEVNLAYVPAAGSGTVSNDGGDDAVIPVVNATNAGLMTPAQMQKLDALSDNFRGSYPELADLVTAHPTGSNGEWAIVRDADSNADFAAWDDASNSWEMTDLDSITGSTNLAYTPSASDGTITSDTGTDATIPLADATNAGLFSPSEKSKLANVEPGAAADQIASEVPSTAYKGTTSVNVQLAIQELTDDKVSDIDAETTNYTGSVATVRFSSIKSDEAQNFVEMAINSATEANAGVMSAADKTKLNGIAANAIASVDLGYAPAANQGTVTNTEGADAILPVVDSSNAGLMSPAEHDKLDNLDMYAEGGEIADTPYISSRGNGIITNYTGLLGNNYNFNYGGNGFVFDGEKTPGLPGSFRFDGYYHTVFSDEFFPVDPNQVYKLQALYMQQSVPGDWSAYTNGDRHRQYMGINQYDADKHIIASNHVMEYRHGGTSSRTTLTQALTPGDTEIHVADASGWQETAGAPSYRRGVIIWAYKNSFGFRYDHYSRLMQPGLFDDGGVDKGTNVITLNQGFPVSMGNPDDPNGTWPVGTELSNSSSGSTYNYAFLGGTIPPTTDDWYRTTAYIGGVDNSTLNYGHNFRPGVAYCKLLWLPNHTLSPGGYSVFPDTGANTYFHFTAPSITPMVYAKQARAANGSVDNHVISTTIGAAPDFVNANTLANRTELLI